MINRVRESRRCIGRRFAVAPTACACLHVCAPLAPTPLGLELSVWQMHSCKTKRTRHGFSLIELIATCILLGVVFSVSVPLLTVVARERRSGEQRQFALQHATNLLERAATRDWSELPVGPQTISPAPADLQSLLPGLERSVEVRELSDELHTKHVIVSLHWNGRSGQPVAPLRLSTWVYPNGKAQP